MTHIYVDGQSDAQMDRKQQKKLKRFQTDQDFVLPGEVWRFTEQLSVGHSERTGRVSNQHRVIQPGSTGRRRHQVAPLQHSERVDMGNR